MHFSLYGKDWYYVRLFSDTFEPVSLNPLEHVFSVNPSGISSYCDASIVFHDQDMPIC